ncbi:MAG: hypothetical protein FJX35_17540 [Alphaproteobacteria bacterium]|nr:hypothetical protein [Alphaproteobacteria bacterium]
MKFFLIEAYGGPAGTDGQIHRFGVRADSLNEAIAMVRNNPKAAHCTHFELVEEGSGSAGAESGIAVSGSDLKQR